MPQENRFDGSPQINSGGPLVVGVSILHHDGRDPLRVGNGQALPDRGAVVLDVVGGDDAVLVSEGQDQVAEHLRAGRGALEQSE